MQSFLTATAHFALFLVPCLLTTVIHIVTTRTTDTPRPPRLTNSSAIATQSPTAIGCPILSALAKGGVTPY